MTEAKNLPIEEEKVQASVIDYSKIANSVAFKSLLSRKKAFILPITIFFFAFYFTLPVLTAYSKVLNAPAIGAITWAWVFAFAQFVMTWGLCILYTRKAAGFDKSVQEIVEQAMKEGTFKP